MADDHNDMTVFVVSAGTGDTGSAAVRAAMIQFRHRWRLRVFRDTRTVSEVRRVVEQAEQANALVVFSLVEGEVVEALQREADNRGVVAVDLLGPLIMRVAQRLKVEDPFIVDRYLAGARFGGIASLLIVNKQDLPVEAGDLSFIEPYRALGLPVVTVSAHTRTGLDALIGQLSGRRSLFAGQSGVGKSSLLNALAGEAVRATGRLSEGSGEGRHTTVSSALLLTPWGEIADSPGVRDYAPPVVPLREVQLGFVEIAARAHECRFPDCLHLREPQCAVQAAVGKGHPHGPHRSQNRKARLYGAH